MITSEQAWNLAKQKQMFLAMIDNERLAELLTEIQHEVLDAAAKLCDDQSELMDKELARPNTSTMTQEKFWAAKSTAMSLAERIRGLKK